MPLVPVESLDDPRLAYYRDLNERNLTRHSGLFIAEGQKVVERLLSSRFDVASVLAEQPLAEKYQPLVRADVPIYVTSRELLANTVGFNFHRGVVACGRRRAATTVESTLTKLTAAKQTIVVCPDVQDPTNLGSIIRTAAGFGCCAIVLGRSCADPFSRRVLRVSMGAALELPIIESRDLARDIQALLAAEFEILASVIDTSAEPLALANRGERLALLLGSEGHGLGAGWQALAQRRVTIPMQLGIDSLNVAVSAAVMLYHFCGRT